MIVFIDHKVASHPTHNKIVCGVNHRENYKECVATAFAKDANEIKKHTHKVL